MAEAGPAVPDKVREIQTWISENLNINYDENFLGNPFLPSDEDTEQAIEEIKEYAKPTITFDLSLFLNFSDNKPIAEAFELSINSKTRRSKQKAKEKCEEIADNYKCSTEGIMVLMVYFCQKPEQSVYANTGNSSPFKEKTQRLTGQDAEIAELEYTNVQLKDKVNTLRTDMEKLTLTFDNQIKTVQAEKEKEKKKL